ncbi:hypothetical protein RJ639_003086 [Escallonia herrerae]|uniref:Transcription repressor n=1 Tax=Escallonia herrerae TaxID=1293975 RepID=A0AA89AWC2_9ASTE|nr:hypothetical protein RJ639_003086 [Escallonia herrerae]
MPAKFYRLIIDPYRNGKQPWALRRRGSPIPTGLAFFLGGTRRQKFRKVPNYLHPIACSGSVKVRRNDQRKAGSKTWGQKKSEKGGSTFIAYVSSLEEPESRNSDRFLTVSSLSHAMVQESCRLSVSSMEEPESRNSEKFLTISSLLHAMGQERLEQMTKERLEARHEDIRRARREGSKLIVMLAIEMSSYYAREDFRESMVEMILTKRISEPKDLRCLLNCYISMNSEEYRGVILEKFRTFFIQRFKLSIKTSQLQQRCNLDIGNHIM